MRWRHQWVQNVAFRWVRRIPLSSRSKTTQGMKLPSVQDEVVLPPTLSGTVSMIKGRQAWSAHLHPASLPFRSMTHKTTELELAKDFHAPWLLQFSPSQPQEEGVLIRVLTTGLLIHRGRTSPKGTSLSVATPDGNQVCLP